MSKSPERADRKDAAQEQAPAAESSGRFARILRFVPGVNRLAGWAGGNWIRRGLVGIGLLSLIVGTVVVWSYLARVALRSGQIPFDVALHALDQGQTEQARNLVSRMLTSGSLPHNEYGGPLFVLGALKAHDAELDTTPDKRRVDFLVASRYLKEARSYGFPAGREKAGTFLLGKSLIESNQIDEGVAIFDELLAAEGDVEGPLSWAIHRVLARTRQLMAEPDLAKAIVHSDKALENPSLSPVERGGALLDRAVCLSRLARFDEARQAVDDVPAEANRRADMLLARAQIILDEVDAKLQKTVAQEHADVLAKAAAGLDEVIRSTDEAASLVRDDLQIARRAGYLRGCALQMKGDADGALHDFSRVRQLFGDSPEGVAAALAEADLLRSGGDFAGALLGYRRVLESINSISSYRSAVMPLARVRARSLVALKDYVERRRYDDALVLLGRFTPLFTRTEELNFRGELLKLWGEQLLQQAPADSWEPSEIRREGLRRLREAGMAYEKLAELRYDTEEYVNDLWTGAENYYRGHNYSRAIQLLDKFLANAPELRNAQALLRLGQSYMALGKVPQSIAAFDECIEFHPQDSATYQARIDCAKASWYNGEVDKSEKLLLDNIAGSELKPSSREWKDSLFQLGMLLYEKKEYEKAIGALEEAIERYKGDPQTLLARYVVGESYRNWAEQLQERDSEVRTTTEREKNQDMATEYLRTALGYFVDVQRAITLAQDVQDDPTKDAMLRNCYMLAGTVLFDLKRYNEAITAYSSVSSKYPKEPFVLETFVQIANCYRRLNQFDKARGAIQQAQIAFNNLPSDADFTNATSLSREEWRQLLDNMANW